MNIILDGEPHPVGQKVEREIRLRKEPKGTIEAVAYDGIGATKRYKRSLWWTYGFVYFALLLGWVLSLGKANTPAAVIITLIIVILFVVMIAYFHRRDIAKWRARSATRIAELPPAGTRASANAEALTINGATYPWTALQVENVEFLKKQAKRRAWYELDRVRVRANDGKSYVIDAFGYQNGMKLIDLAANRLWPQIGPAVGR
ncbi:MAG TPA: hypothetical protein PL193_13025 [Xanthobacteraceae bacterium]|nr:hypothetical protein [Xanthobacteraceae bacterium]